MKNNYFKKSVLFLIILIVWTGILFAQSEGRYFDSLETKAKELTVTILYPSMGTIRSIIGLRDQGFFPTENIIVVGAYHEKETTNYKRSQSYVKGQKLDWFKFHKITGEIGRDNLFQKNGCSSDFEKIFKKSDGIIFFGGADIPPEIYEAKTNLLTGIRTPYRHYMEISFIYHLLGGYQDKHFRALLESEPEFPVLGICLGEQTLNVGTGGTLFQDVWFERYGKKYLEDVVDLGKDNWHTNPLARLYPEEKLLGYNLHPIKFKEGGKFISVLGFTKEDHPFIISAHHQAVNKLGKGMKITATTMNGKVVEAIEHEWFSHVLGVQFHPEFPMLWDKDKKYRIELEDEGKSIPAILEENPPSFEFHKRLWAWFSEKVQDYHDKSRR